MSATKSTAEALPIQHLAESDARLDQHLGAVADDLPADALQAPVAERAQPPWPIQSEYDAMAWGFRIAQLRARAAWARDMAKQIERQAEAEERRLVFAVGGRSFKEGDKERVGYGQVEEWARANLPRGKKSIKTPAGTFAFRAAPAMAKVREGADAALLAWCNEHAPDWVKTVETVDMAAIRALIEETGEVPADQNGEPLVEYFAADRRDLFSFTPADGAGVAPLGPGIHRPHLEESVS